MDSNSTMNGDYLTLPSNANFNDIPSDFGYPVLGKVLPFFKNPHEISKDHYNRLGPISGLKLGNEFSIIALTPDIVQQILLDPEQNFSSKMGFVRYEPFLGDGILTLDFDIHKKHRRLMQTAFKTPAMRGYLPSMHAITSRSISDMPLDQEFIFFSEIKKIMLALSIKIFTGIDDQNNDHLSQDFLNFVESFMYIFPVNLPGFAFHKGLKAKDNIAKFIKPLISTKRAGNGSDILSYFCREKDEDGHFFSDEVIIDNFVLLLFASQDTTTAALTNTLLELGRSPEWQQRLREESQQLNKVDLAYEDFSKLGSYDLLFNEIQRLYPSVPIIPRRTIRPCQLAGVDIPAHTVINIITMFNHRMDEWWTNPDQFDPDRFSRNEHKGHPFLFHPFGGGAHKCIGMHFSQYVYKTFLHQLLLQYEVVVDANYTPEMQYLPMPRPKDGLPIRLIKI